MRIVIHKPQNSWILLLLRLQLAWVFMWAVGLATAVYIDDYLYNPTPALTHSIQVGKTVLLKIEELTVETLASSRYELAGQYHLVSAGPEFMTVTGQELLFEPLKYDLGDWQLIFAPEEQGLPQRLVLNVHVIAHTADWDKLAADVQAVLGGQAEYYGVVVQDMLRGTTWSWQAEARFPIASTVKVPMSLLALRDIDAGLYTLEDTYPIQDQYKHFGGALLDGYPQGTLVTIAEYIHRALSYSSNTALYHLRAMLGGTTIVNERITNELHANPFFEDPLVATPQAVATVFAGIYNHDFISDDLTKFLFEQMRNSVPALRQGIPAGIGDDNAYIVNKVGFLFGGREGNTYGDAAIVYAPTADFVLVILNNRAPEFPLGQYMIQDIAQAVFENFQ